MTAVSPMTTPVPWSMKKPAPICAPGCRSMPVWLVRKFGHDACEQGQLQPVQLVRDAVVDHGQHAGVAQQNFVHTACGRVAVVGREHVGIEQAADAGAAPRQRCAPVPARAHPSALLGWPRGPSRRAGVAQFQPRLRQQGVQRGIERVADVEVFTFAPQVTRAQAHRGTRRL